MIMKSKYASLYGRFGRLWIVCRATNSRNNMIRYTCRCDCGNVVIVRGSHLARGESTSCGCFKDNVIAINKASNTTHGHSGSPTYESWQAMLSRCENKKHPAYHRYGGRGITVCERWKQFDNFLSDMGERPKGLDLGRKDNDGGYFKGNCRWETPLQNARNRSTNHLLTLNGTTMCISEWASVRGMGKTTLRNRLSKGWSVEKALMTPVQHQGACL